MTKNPRHKTKVVFGVPPKKFSLEWYIFPDFQLNDAGPNKGVYWKQFYNPGE